MTINPEVEEVKILKTGGKFHLVCVQKAAVIRKKLSLWQVLLTNEMRGQWGWFILVYLAWSIKAAIIAGGTK